MDFLPEPARQTPVAVEVDLCVIGGSCTGVFAAVRAARLGLRVALVEVGTIFGGMATAAQVNEWHSLYDVPDRVQIIGGLTSEMLERLRRRNALFEEPDRSKRGHYRFNSAELALELDALVREHAGIRPFLAARCVGAIREGDRLRAALIEDRSGRRAISAGAFIDASGDGELLRRAGFEVHRPDTLQPVNFQVLAAGLQAAQKQHGDLWETALLLAEAHDYPLENARPWFFGYPSAADVTNVFGARMNGVDASDADQFTAALLEGRRRHSALFDMMREATGAPLGIIGLAHTLGVRETWHACCRHRLRAEELLHGTRFPDAIANGTYPVDVHSSEGTLLRFLDGREVFVKKLGGVERRRWLPEEDPGQPFYQIPYRALVPEGAANLLVAGRLLDADREAYGGVRVMVNMNQTGEAAGVAAALTLGGCQPVDFADISTDQLRETLARGGSIVL
jgi:hypothetical protein